MFWIVVDELLHIQIPPTGYVGVILRTTAATASRSTVDGTRRVHAVTAVYPQSTLNSTPTYSNHGGTT